MSLTTPGKPMVAIFKHDDTGRTTRDSVHLWQELEDGTVTGLIVDQRDGRLRSASSYANFVRYEADQNCDHLIPAPAGMTAVYDDHLSDIHYIQICDGETTLLTMDPDGYLMPISECDGCVQVKASLVETVLELDTKESDS